MYKKLHDKLLLYNQEHLLAFWNELSLREQRVLAKQINEVNWEELKHLISEYVLKKSHLTLPENLKPSPYYPLNPNSLAEVELYKKAVIEGEKIVSSGKVAAFTVAGGQGTRLGYDGPKGTYPITPVKNKSLFQYFSEKIRRAEEKYSTEIPWYIMTSEVNHASTVAFFEKNNYFSLKENDVMFFNQGTMPAINKEGKVLLETKNTLSLSPNGHGGSLLALRNSGALADMAKKKIDYLSYFQVDNPLVPIIDLLFIGLHSLCKSEMSALMIPKTGPYEKLGNFCVSNGHTMIIEYSDLPSELAERKNKDGKLSFIAGSPAIHILNRSFIERLTKNNTMSLPWHRADKKVSYINEKGEKIMPETENAVKLESFIFDALPIAKKTMILEVERSKQFAPTKNRVGIDSVESCQEMLMQRDAYWLEKYANIIIPRTPDGKVDCKIELSPKSFLDEEDVKNSKHKFKNIERNSVVYYE